ncbi:hypothetical protein BGZ58_004618 [Dissophora ornata]|nr:hypothetical protein BGZ58_004618 [Dissophora ornata]
MNPGLGFNLDNPYSPFDASYKFLNSGTLRSDIDPRDTDLKAPVNTVSTLSQQQQTCLPADQDPWTDIMAFDEACIPLRQMLSGFTPPSSTSSNSLSSMSTPPLQTPTSETSSSDPFRSRMSSINSDQLISQPGGPYVCTHEYNALFDKLVPSNKSYHSDLKYSKRESLAPSDTLRQHNTTNKVNESDKCHPVDSQDDMEYDGQDMSDQHESDMDVDSSESDDDAEDGETSSSKNSFVSRESSSSVSESTKVPRALAPARTTTKSSTNSTKSSPKSSSKTKRSINGKNSANTKNATSSSSSRKAKVTSTKNSSRESSTTSKGSSQSRKHASSEEESSEAKRQKFLERNRMAAAKCREKKRLQTLKTIADADAITERNMALHESLDELQEEVRTLKNQILCHRDCGCDVIQKFVQSSFSAVSFHPAGSSAIANQMQMSSSRPRAQLF